MKTNVYTYDVGKDKLVRCPDHAFDYHKYVLDEDVAEDEDCCTTCAYSAAEAERLVCHDCNITIREYHE